MLHDSAEVNPFRCERKGRVAIPRPFCPTGQRRRRPPKPLIPLMPSTVHGVVFDIFALGTQQPRAEPDLIRLCRYCITRRPLVVTRCVWPPGRTGRRVPAALPVPGG